jgi:hypothetical protein
VNSQEEDVQNEAQACHGKIDPTTCVMLSTRSATQCRDGAYHCTVSNEVAFFPLKKYLEAMSGPVNEATPWNPCAKLSRAAAYLFDPRTAMYEFAATSSVERPQPKLGGGWNDENGGFG